MTPTQRTLKRLRDAGIPCERVEQKLPIPGMHVTRDLFNVIDLVALDGAIVGIQVTSGSNVAKRQSKINAEPLALAWVRAGGRLEIHGWRKGGKRGERKTYQCRVLKASVLPGGDKLLWEESTC